MAVLRLGSNNTAVRKLQGDLNRAGAEPALKVDGDFGEKTDAAVRSFQDRAGLVVDGKVGPQTQTALTRLLARAEIRRPEPDKSAMDVPATGGGQGGNAIAPPNVATLQLLDTARPIDEIVVHCAATPEGKNFTVADIRAWHKARGWSDIGYHYVAYLDGKIMLGRPIGQIGAHVAGRNARTIGICYVGGVSADGKTAKDTRTAAQRASLLWLVRALVKKHRGIVRVTGHNEYAAKACPSFDVRKDALGQVV